MKDTLQQILTLYKALPREPESPATLNELMNKDSVREAYINPKVKVDSTRRKIKRHLEQLEKILMHNMMINEGYQQTYQLTKNAQLDQTDNKTAMMMLLAGSFLQKVLPVDEYKELQWVFENARDKLEDDTKLKHWQQKIYFADNEAEFAPVNAEVETKIYTALLTDSPIKVKYCKIGSDKEREHIGFPLKLVVKANERLLIIENPKHNGTLTLLLSRIKTVEEVSLIKDMPERLNIDLMKLTNEINHHIQPMFMTEPVELTLLLNQEHQNIIKESHFFRNVNHKFYEPHYHTQQLVTLSEIYITQSLCDFLVLNADKLIVVSPQVLSENVQETLDVGASGYFELEGDITDGVIIIEDEIVTTRSQQMYDKSNVDELDDDWEDEYDEIFDCDNDEPEEDGDFNECLRHDKARKASFYNDLSTEDEIGLLNMKRMIHKFWDYLIHFEDADNRMESVMPLSKSRQHRLIHFCINILEDTLIFYRDLLEDDDRQNDSCNKEDKWENVISYEPSRSYSNNKSFSQVLIEMEKTAFYESEYDEERLRWIKSNIQWMMYLIYHRGLNYSNEERAKMIDDLFEIIDR